jgi:2-methylcitrate dehydratase PrpD
VNLAYLVKRGGPGLPSVTENMLFKISYLAEFHAQTAVEAAPIVHDKLKLLGKLSDDILRQHGQYLWSHQPNCQRK